MSDRYAMRDGVPKREAVMDNEAYSVTEDANGDKRRQHGQPPAIALARIHRESCSRPNLSKRAFLVPVEVRSSDWEGDFTGELPHFVCRCRVPCGGKGNKVSMLPPLFRPSIALICALCDKVVPRKGEQRKKQSPNPDRYDEETPRHVVDDHYQWIDSCRRMERASQMHCDHR